MDCDTRTVLRIAIISFFTRFLLPFFARRLSIIIIVFAIIVIIQPFIVIAHYALIQRTNE